MLPRAGWTHNVEPIFLVGCQRSGTTWLQAMLACHPAIYTGPETQFFSYFAASESAYRRSDHHRNGLAEYCSPEEYYRFIAAAYWSFVSSLPEPPTLPAYFLDKTPHHCQHANFILHTFPRARFLHLIRDGRAVVASFLRASRTWDRSWESNTVDRATLQWMKLIRAGRRIPALVSVSAQYCEIKYEDLRRDAKAQLTRLFDWLNLPADANLIRSIIESNSLEQARNSKKPFASIPFPNQSAKPTNEKPPFPDGFIGPAPFRHEDVQLTHWERLRVEKLAGSVLRELDYPDVKRLSIFQRLLVSTKVRSWLRLPPL